MALRTRFVAVVLAFGCQSVAVVPALSAQAPAEAAAHNPTSAEVVQMMKDVANPGPWGAADEIGTFNLITRAKRKEAAALVREGLSVSLAHTLDNEVLADNPTPFKIEFLRRDGKMLTGAAMDVISSTYHATTTTHMDSPCHCIFEGKTYNDGRPRPIHMLSINRLRMPMLEVADLEEVARVAVRLKRWAFMLTVAALPAPGGSGSPVNPIATS